jgi:hypothetical protein
VAPATVGLATDVIRVDADERETVVAVAGERSLGAADLAAVLTAVGDEPEPERVDRAVAVWQAALPLAGRAAAPAPAEAAGGPVTIERVLRALASGRTVVRRLPVDRAVGDPERYVADPARVRLLVASIAPASVSPAGSGVRLRILNPSGDEQVAYHAVTRALAAGAEVVLVDGTPGAVPDSSGLVRTPGDRANEVQALAAGVGAASVASTDERIDGIDATLTLGQDAVTAARRSTTTSPAPASTGTATAPSGATLVPSGPATTTGATTTTTKKTP